MLRRAGGVFLVVLVPLGLLMALALVTAVAATPSAAIAQVTPQQPGASRELAGGAAPVVERSVVVAPLWRAPTLVRIAALVAAALGLLGLVGVRPRQVAAADVRLADGEHRLGTRHRGPPLRLA